MSSKLDPAAHCCHNQTQQDRGARVWALLAHLQYFPSLISTHNRSNTGVTECHESCSPSTSYKVILNWVPGKSTIQHKYLFKLCQHVCEYASCLGMLYLCTNVLCFVCVHVLHTHTQAWMYSELHSMHSCFLDNSAECRCRRQQHGGNSSGTSGCCHSASSDKTAVSYFPTIGNGSLRLGTLDENVAQEERSGQHKAPSKHCACSQPFCCYI